VAVGRVFVVLHPVPDEPPAPRPDRLEDGRQEVGPTLPVDDAVGV
jgi:hypothetical protein